MCQRHSFILTKAGKVFDGLGLTDSHTKIRELAGLDVNDDSVNAYEWQPPKGWPETSWIVGLTIDCQVFEPKQSHFNRIEAHLKRLYPSMVEWERGDERRDTPVTLKKLGWAELKDGEVVSPKKGDRFFVVSGTVTVSCQSGGDCRSYGNSTLNSTGQTGGYCRSNGNSTLNSTGQTGGYCWSDGNSTLNTF